MGKDAKPTSKKDKENAVHKKGSKSTDKKPVNDAKDGSKKKSGGVSEK